MTSPAWSSTGAEARLRQACSRGARRGPRPATGPRRRRCCRCPTRPSGRGGTRLTALSLAFIRRTTAAWSHAASSGSGAMWAIGSGTPSSSSSARASAAEGALVDEPQLGPAVGEPEPGVQVLLLRGVRPARRAAGRSCPRWRIRPTESPRGRARGTCRAAGPRRPGGSTRRSARSLRAGHVATGDPVRRGARAADGAADDVVGEAAADDLDLGELRHAGSRRPSGSSSSASPSGAAPRRGRGPGPRAGRDRRPGLLGGLLLGVLLAAAGPAAEDLVARRRRSASNSFSWSGPSSVDEVLGGAEAGRDVPAPAGWSSSPGRRRGSPTGPSAGRRGGGRARPPRRCRPER